MKRPLFEGQQVRFIRVRTCALREDEHALALPTHLRGCCVECSERILTVAAVNEDGFGETHYRGISQQTLKV